MENEPKSGSSRVCGGGGGKGTKEKADCNSCSLGCGASTHTKQI